MTTPKPISIQLYSLRQEAAAAGIEKVLERVAAIGYAGVEPAGLGGLTPERYRQVASGLGLQIPSNHTALPVGDAATAVLDEQEALGNTVLISGGSPADVQTLDAVRDLAARFEEAAANAKARGMTVGYHNHWWEFDTPIEGGRAPHDVLLSEAPSVFAQVDTYWSTVGGRDTVALVAGLGARARFLHVKDGMIDPPRPHVAVGSGKMPIEDILRAAPETEWHVVELDECATDMFEAVEQSYRFLVGSGLSKGRKDV